MLKIIYALVLLLMCAMPARAGVEPFYQGEWGMGPAQIMTLARGTYVPLSNDIWQVWASGDLYLLEYRHQIDGFDATTQYIFWDDKLMCVGMNLSAHNLDYPGAQKLAALWENALHSQLPQTAYIAEDSFFGDREYQGRWLRLILFQDAKQIINVTCFYSASGQTLNFLLSAWDPRHPQNSEALAMHAKIQQKLEQRRSADKLNP